MRTNIDIDEELIRDLMESTGLRTKKEVVNLALRELQRKTGREGLLALEGKLHFWPGYDPEGGEQSESDWDWPDGDDR